MADKKKTKEIRYVNNVLKTDGGRIMGIGTAEIKGYNVVTKVSIEYLERAIKIIKTLHEGEGGISIDVAIAGNFPLIIGEYDEETNSIAGVIIAPRVESK